MIWSDLAKAKEVLSRHTRVRQAAQELGVSTDALTNAFRRQSLVASDFLRTVDWDEIMPEGQRLRGNSTLLDEAGEVERRWVKTERASDEPTNILPIPEGHFVKKVSTLVDGQGQVRAQWIQAPKEEQHRWQEAVEAIERHVESYRSLAEPVTPPEEHDEDLLSLIPLGDPHIGLLSWHRETGEDFDLKIAERDLIRVVDMLVDRAPSSKRGVLASLGDLFHFDSDNQLTPTGGNKLDCDSRLTKVTDVGFNIMRRLIDRMLSKHAFVDVVTLPGNHDPRMSRLLRMWLQAVYEREPRAKIWDNADPFTYLRHGKVLLGFVHGDGAKVGDLPAIMAADRAQDWGETEYRSWITGHVHHRTEAEYPGVTVETFRTLAAKDYWHHWKGYRAGRSLSCITYSKEFGEVTRSTVDLKLARQ